MGYDEKCISHELDNRKAKFIIAGSLPGQPSQWLECLEPSEGTPVRQIYIIQRHRRWCIKKSNVRQRNTSRQTIESPDQTRIQRYPAYALSRRCVGRRIPAHK